MSVVFYTLASIALLFFIIDKILEYWVVWKRYGYLLKERFRK